MRERRHQHRHDGQGRDDTCLTSCHSCHEHYLLNGNSYEKYRNQPASTRSWVQTTGAAAPRISCASPMFQPPRTPGESVYDVTRAGAPASSNCSVHCSTFSIKTLIIGRTRQIRLAATAGDVSVAVTP